MKVAVALSLLAGCWIGLKLAQWIGAKFWVRLIAVALWVTGILFLSMALYAYAGNCAGVTFAEDEAGPDPRTPLVLYLVAWPAAWVIALFSGFSVRLFLARDLPAFAAGVTLLCVCCAAPIMVFAPRLFEACAPTPLN